MADTILAVAPRIAVRELAPLPMAKLRLRQPTSADLERIGSVMGIVPPIAPNTIATNGAVQVIWMGPDDWLVVGRIGPLEAIEEAAADATSALCVNVGDGRCIFDVTGADGAELLAKGTSIDLHRVLSSETMSATTMFAQINTVIYRPAGLDGFRLIFDVSLRDYIRKWFQESAIEFGAQA